MTTPDNTGAVTALRADAYDSWQSIAADMERAARLPDTQHPPLSYWKSRVCALVALASPPEDAPAVDGGDADDVPTVTLDDDARYRIARALCDDNAARTGNYANDVWTLYSDDFYSDADIVIAAILVGRSHG